jgi:hypothetical protein
MRYRPKSTPHPATVEVTRESPGGEMMEDWEFEHHATSSEIEHELQETIICPDCGFDYGYDRSHKKIPKNSTNAWKFNVVCENCENLFLVSWDWDANQEEPSDGDIEFTTYHVDQSKVLEV